ncbi:MAG: septum formation initiator family protein [Omnitrophica bacterium]|nr:septum formation initiator family protein [Candidatus Omnitrophota bacterium]
MVVRLLNARRVKRLKIALIISAVFTIVMVLYFPNYAKLKKLRDANKDFISKSDNLKNEIADYKQKSETIGQDPYLYEKIARDDLGVAKENEIIIDISE